MPEDKKRNGTANSKDRAKKSSSTNVNKTGTTRKSEQSSSHRSGSASQERAKQHQSAAKKEAAKASKPAKSKPADKNAGAGKKKEASPASLSKKSTKTSTRKTQNVRQSSTAKKTEQAKKQKAAPRKSKSRSRAKLLNVLPYVLMTLAFIGVMIVLSLTVFFKVENLKVKIEGEVPYPSEDIITVCPVKTGQNIFSDTIAEAGATVESELPYIEHCTAERKMPDTVVLSIVGAKPAGMFTLSDGSRLIISSTGKILEMLAPADMSGSDIAAQQPAPVDSNTDLSSADISATDGVTGGFMLNDGMVLSSHSKYLDETTLAVLEGLVVTGGKVGSPVETGDETVYATLEAMVELLEANELTATRIDLTPGDLYVEYEGRMNIRLGSGSQLEEKITMAAEIIKNRLTKYDSGQIDVSNPQKAYYTPKYITG